MRHISKKELEALAEYIIFSHTEDIEYLSIWEMTEDRLELEPSADNQNIVDQVEDIMRKAKITITFED